MNISDSLIVQVIRINEDSSARLLADFCSKLGYVTEVIPIRPDDQPAASEYCPDLIIICPSAVDENKSRQELAKILSQLPNNTGVIWAAIPAEFSDSIAECYQLGVAEVIRLPWVSDELKYKLSSLHLRKSKLPKPDVGLATRDSSARHLAEQLREKEQQLKLALDFGRMAWWSLNLETNLLQLNDQYFELLGTTAAENGGYEMDLFDWADRFVHRDDMFIIRSELEAIQKHSGETKHGSFFYRTFYGSGDLGYMYVQYSFQREATGPDKVIGFSKDITDKKLDEREYRANKQQLEMTQLAIETAHIGVYQINDEGIIEYVNLYATAMTGYSREELYGMHITELDANLNMENWLKFRKEMLEKPYLLFETQHRKKDGGILDVEISGHYVELEGKLFTYSFVRDLTELKSHKRSLAEKDDKFSKILAQTTNVGVIGIDQHLRVVYWSKMAESITGYQATEMLGKNPIDRFFHPDQRQLAKKEILEALRSGIAPPPWELELKHKDGHLVNILSNPLILTEDGERRFYLIDVDLTEIRSAEEARDHSLVQMKKALEEAGQANKTKDQFLELMSHELRTPLNPIIGLADLLRKDSDGESKEHLDTIYHSGRRLQSLITDIIDFNSLRTRSMSPIMSEFNLLKLCENSIEAARPLKNTLTLRLENSLANTTPIPPDVNVVSDSRFVQKILTHLLENACKYTLSGEVCLKTGLIQSDRNDQDVLFCARIDGTEIGVDAETLKTALNPLFDHQNNTLEKLKGNGLGLAISKQMVELLKGNIDASIQSDDGSVFSLTLPMKRVRHQQAEKNSKTHFKWLRLAENPKILIAGDSPNNAKIINVMLCKMGCQSSFAYNGVEVIRMAAKEAFDLVLMDLRMPMVSGYEACTKIRQSEGPNQFVPIIALSTQPTKEESEACKGAGISDFIENPVTPDKLEKTLIQYLKKSSESSD